MEAEWMGDTDGACCEDRIGHGALPARAAEGEIKERKGGGVRSTRQACGRPCSQKKKGGRGNGGVQYEGQGERVESRPDVGEKEKRTVHKDGECGMMLRPRENGELRARY